MIAYILFRLVLIFVPDADVLAFAHTAPEQLELEVARAHYAAAFAAGVVHDVAPELLLSIAAHESRYQHAAVGPESGGRVSCGAMTPEPVAACPRGATLLDEYMAGATHLRTWYAAGDVRDRREALLGYAGGYRLIRACRAGSVNVERQGRTIDLCNTPDVFIARGAWIRRAIQRGRTWTNN